MKISKLFPFLGGKKKQEVPAGELVHLQIGGQDWVGDMEHAIAQLKRERRFAEASTMYEQLIEANPDNWDYLNRAGNFELDTLGNLEKAASYHQKALTLTDVDSQLAISHRNLGRVYETQGCLPEALEEFCQSVDIRRRMYGEEHPDIALGYNHIGGVYHVMGQFDKAHEYYSKARDINVKVYGDQHPSVASNYSNDGILYYEQGDYEQALDCHRKSLNIKLFVFGDEHHSVATSYFNLATVYQAQQNLAEALNCYRRALDIRLKVLGKGSYLTGICYSKIGMVCHTMGHLAEAIENYEKAYEIFSRIAGPMHPETMAISKALSDLKVIQSAENESFPPPQRTRINTNT